MRTAQKFPTTLALLALVLGGSLPLPAGALFPSIVPPRPTGTFGELVVQQYVAPARDLPGTIRFIVNFVLGIVAILVLAMLVLALFRAVTAPGEEAAEAARGTVLNAIIGLIIIGIAAAVVNFFIGAVLVPAP